MHMFTLRLSASYFSPAGPNELGYMSAETVCHKVGLQIVCCVCSVVPTSVSCCTVGIGGMWASLVYSAGVFHTTTTAALCVPSKECLSALTLCACRSRCMLAWDMY